MARLDWGDPERPVDLVFLHATGFNALTYRSLLEPLADRFHVAAPDLRGHGQTALPTDSARHSSWNTYATGRLSWRGIRWAPPHPCWSPHGRRSG